MTRYWKLGLGICLAICAAGVVVGIGVQKLKQRRLIQGANVMRARAEKGDAKAQFHLGSMYYYGKGLPQDYAQAVGWYRKSAEQGDALAEFSLGLMYHNGRGLPQDYTEAAHWYRKASEQGEPKSQVSLASMYFYGNGVTQGYEEAARWYRKAAEQGEPKGELGLAAAYFYGKGLPRDYAEVSAGTASLRSMGTRRLSLVSDPYTAKERVCSRTMPRRSLGIARLQAKGMRVPNMPSGICITTGRAFHGTIVQRYGGYTRQLTTGPQMRSSFFDLSIKGRLQPKRSTISFFSLHLAGIVLPSGFLTFGKECSKFTA